MNHGVVADNKHVSKQQRTVAEVLPPMEQPSVQLARRVRPTVDQRGVCRRDAGRRGSNAPRPQNGPFRLQSVLSGVWGGGVSSCLLPLFLFFFFSMFLITRFIFWRMLFVYTDTVRRTSRQTSDRHIEGRSAGRHEIFVGLYVQRRGNYCILYGVLSYTKYINIPIPETAVVAAKQLHSAHLNVYRLV